MILEDILWKVEMILKAAKLNLEFRLTTRQYNIESPFTRPFSATLYFSNILAVMTSGMNVHSKKKKFSLLLVGL